MLTISASADSPTNQAVKRVVLVQTGALYQKRNFCLYYEALQLLYYQCFFSHREAKGSFCRLCPTSCVLRTQMQPPLFAVILRRRRLELRSQGLPWGDRIHAGRTRLWVNQRKHQETRMTQLSWICTCVHFASPCKRRYEFPFPDLP